jgi:hypothetical protein
MDEAVVKYALHRRFIRAVYNTREPKRVMMLRHALLCSLWAAFAVTSGPGQGQVWSFTADPVDAVPTGFTLAAMRQATPGQWLIREDGPDRFLAHRADAASAGYALALAPVEPHRDVIVQARLRLRGGARAGGVVWRYQDAQNYYTAILDLQRRALAMHRVANGNRITIEWKGELELDPEAWHLLKVVHDDRFVWVSLGGIRVFDERDRQLDRFGPGLAGVVATGDSEVWFDDLKVEHKRGREGR